MARFCMQDVQSVLRGIQSVANASVKHHAAEWRTVWDNSSVKVLIVNELNDTLKDEPRPRPTPKGSGNRSANVQNGVSNNIIETFERTAVVFEGIRAYANYVGTKPIEFKQQQQQQTSQMEVQELDRSAEILSSNFNPNQSTQMKNEDIGTGTGNEFMAQGKEQSLYKLQNSASTTVKEPLINVDKKKYIPEEPNVILTPKPPAAQQVLDAFVVPPLMQRTTQKLPIKKQSLSATAKQRKVPSSRIERLVSFGSLAAGLGIGTVAEMTRRTLGLTEKPDDGGGTTLDSAFLSPANAERIVDTLCKVRGAALKVGQMLSIQDNTVLSPTLQKAFERVRQSADFMPTWQVEKVLVSELGDDWRSKVASFDPKPFAAASIGQVHYATLHDGMQVAMKIQYPGVAQGITSDIDNLVGIMKVWNMFPEGMFIDNLTKVAKRELAREVDYERELECTKKFKKYLEPYPDCYVPMVIDQLCSKQIFSTELIGGIPVDKCVDLDVETREHICRMVMQLCLRELFEFRFMQTDPNWSNFFYSPETRQLILLDFGASREYGKEFMDRYIQIVKGAAVGRRDIVLNLSREIGFLTGYESKVMEEAHVDIFMIMGEIFQSETPFDFGAQDATRRIQHLLPTLIENRLCPPPEEIYSLHRKLSGVFLLCAKLNAKVECRTMFEDVCNSYMSEGST